MIPDHDEYKIMTPLGIIDISNDTCRRDETILTKMWQENKLQPDHYSKLARRRDISK